MCVCFFVCVSFDWGIVLLMVVAVVVDGFGSQYVPGHFAW